MIAIYSKSSVYAKPIRFPSCLNSGYFGNQNPCYILIIYTCKEFLPALATIRVPGSHTIRTFYINK